MYQFSKRALASILCLIMTAVVTAPALLVGAADGQQAYAAKVLYTLDQNDLSGGQSASEALRASADGYRNVEVLGVTDNIFAYDEHYHNEYLDDSVEHVSQHTPIKFLTATDNDQGIKNITYKITSSNPNGFEKLDVSFIGRVDSWTGTSDYTGFLTVRCSENEPQGSFESDGYFDGFSDKRKITSTHKTEKLVNFGPQVERDNLTPDYYNFGETLTLTDEVKGKNEYYINFSFASEQALYTALADITFTEYIPVDYTDSEAFDRLVIANGDCTYNDNGSMQWQNANRAEVSDYIMGTNGVGGVKDEYLVKNVGSYNGHPHFQNHVDPSDESNSKYGFAPIMWFGWGFCEVTYKLRAPEGKTFQGLTFDYDGSVSLKENAGKSTATAITTFIGDSDTEMGVANRLMSYTDKDGNIVQNLGTDLDAFSVVIDNKSEVWVKLQIAGGDVTPHYSGAGVDFNYVDTYIQKMKITAAFNTEKVPQGTEITDDAYASKLLYSLNSSSLAGDNNKGAYSPISEEIAAAAANYNNVEVLGVSDDIIFSKRGLSNTNNAGLPESEQLLRLIASSGVRNITYKITSSNPDGFDELDISYIAGVNSADGSSYVAITGSDTAPVGNFCDEGYFQNFRDIKRITDTNLNYDSTSIESKDYYDYGDTLVLTDAVKGKSEYYVNFSFNSEDWEKAWISDISFSEKIKADFSNSDIYTTMTMVDMDYSGQPSRSWLGTDWDNGNTSGGSLIATPTENCEVVDIKKNLSFDGDGTTNWLAFIPDCNGNTWGSGSFVLKLTAPENSVFKGLNIDLDGKNTIDSCAGANLATSVSVGVSDEYEKYTVPSFYTFTTNTGIVKRFMSYTDKNSVVKKNTGDLSAFKVIGNNKNVMYVKITVGGGLSGWNYISKMKIDGIFAEESVIDNVEFSGKGAFPTDGTLKAIYKTAYPKTGEEMPKQLTFILAAYTTSNQLVSVKVLTVDNPEANKDYTVELTGLPENSNDYYAKAFVWSNMSEMNPVSNTFTLGKK